MNQRLLNLIDEHTLALLRSSLQPLALLFLLFSGCTTTPTPDLNQWVPEGMYHFRSEIINQDNLARVTHASGNIEVQLLGDFDGGFLLVPLPENQVRIEKSRMDYPGLKRSYKGEGTVRQPGIASGTAITWLKSAGPVSRNHRKGTWLLRPATEDEIQRYERKQRERAEREQRAREAGL